MGKSIKLENCPFCGQWLELSYDPICNDYGELTEWWVLTGHTEYGCFMDDVLDEVKPMDYDEAIRFALKWNKRAAVKCGACKWFQYEATPQDDKYPHFCRLHGTDMVTPKSSCSFGERA